MVWYESSFFKFVAYIGAFIILFATNTVPVYALYFMPYLRYKQKFA